MADESCLDCLRLWYLKCLCVLNHTFIVIIFKSGTCFFTFGHNFLFFWVFTQFHVSLRFSLNSELHNHSLVTVISGEEEHFEDFGESNTSALLLESSVEGTEGERDSPVVQPEHINGSSLLSPRYELFFPTQRPGCLLGKPSLFIYLYWVFPVDGCWKLIEYW